MGTTVTGWIVSFKTIKYIALPLVGVGVLTRFFSKREIWHYIGEVIFGFGILFLGMEIMKQGFAPLRESPAFIEMFRQIDGSSFISVVFGVAIGTLATLIVQSSSAVIGISIALASQGLLNFEGGVAVVLGGNIGTTITAILASIGASTAAKRTALAHTLFNVIGVVFFLIFFYPFVAFINVLLPGDATLVEYVPKHIALAHTVFNITAVIVFIPFIKILATLCEKIIPEREGEKLRPSGFLNIDANLLETPSIGLIESEKELGVMSDRILESVILLRDLSNSKDELRKCSEKILKNEDIIDKYQLYITEFLVALSSRALSQNDASMVGNYMSYAHNLEKMADFIEHITLILDKIERKGSALTDEARDNANRILDENIEFFRKTMDQFKKGPKADKNFMEEANVIGRRVKSLVKDAKLAHFERLREKVCRSQTAVYYVDILNNLDGMRSQIYNMAEIATGSKFTQ